MIGDFVEQVSVSYIAIVKIPFTRCQFLNYEKKKKRTNPYIHS